MEKNKQYALDHLHHTEIQVGQYVETNGDGSGVLDHNQKPVRGIVSEVMKNPRNNRWQFYILNNTHEGSWNEVEPTQKGYKYSFKVKFSSPGYITLIDKQDMGNCERTENPSVLKRVSTLLKKTLDKDTKTLLKAGYLDETLCLTARGQEALDAIAYGVHKAELVASAQEDLDEAKEEDAE